MKSFCFAILIALSTSLVAESAERCHVTVRTTMKSGKLKKRIFHTKAATESECAEDAKLHETNFFPPKISKVESTYRFGEAESAQ